ncbi:MAG: hypothetical protein RL202_47 [Actinomycetota bacterium]
MRTSKPKILVVIARLNVGGTAQYIEKLVNGLNSNGFDAVIATGYVQGSEREDPRVSGLPIMRIPSLGRKISPIQDLKAWLELRKTVKTFQPDLIYSHTHSRLVYWLEPFLLRPDEYMLFTVTC